MKLNGGKANSLLEKMLKSGTLKSEMLKESRVMEEPEQVSTPIPMLNLAWSGKWNGGITPGITTIAGPSKHFKTSFGLVGAAAYLNKYDDAICIFYDNEFGAKKQYFQQYGVDIDRVIHVPFETIETLKSDMANKINDLTEDEHCIIVIDSIGNAASNKEVEDAINEKMVADMTRAKALKGLFRIVTPKLNLKNIPLLVINHTYKTMELYAKDVVGGGCLVAGTKIIMGDGTFKEIEKINVGDVVKTKDGNQIVTHTWNPETLEHGHAECLEITFEDGHSITCTKNHKFLINDEWIEAKDLRPSDIVSICR